jgi:hypothetical protein
LQANKYSKLIVTLAWPAVRDKNITAFDPGKTALTQMEHPKDANHHLAQMR